jgi:hypothetical protein
MARCLTAALWHQLTEDITTSMREGPIQHPKATLREIETELDAPRARAPARMREDLALQTTATTWQHAARLATRTCPQCGTRPERGAHRPILLTHGGHNLTLDRSDGVCPACASRLFPPR